MPHVVQNIRSEHVQLLYLHMISQPEQIHQLLKKTHAQQVAEMESSKLAGENARRGRAEPRGFGSLAASKEASAKRVLKLDRTLSVEDKELAAQKLSNAELRKQVSELTRCKKESSKTVSTLQTVVKKKTSEMKLLQERFAVLKALREQSENKVHELEHTLAFEEAQLLVERRLRREVSDVLSSEDASKPARGGSGEDSVRRGVRAGHQDGFHLRSV